MELRKITDRIYYLPNEEESDRPVLGYIRGDKFSLVVDAGNSEKHVQKFYNELENAGLTLPDYTVMTHWHWDHTFGMHAVHGKSISSRRTNEKLKEVSCWQWGDIAMAERLKTGEDIEFCDRCIKVEYPDRTQIKVVTADIDFKGSLRIDLGGVCCDLMEVTAPHSEDSVLIHVPSEGTIFMGDAYGADYYHNHGNYDKNKLMEFVEFLSAAEFHTSVLGHDEPESKEKTIAYLKDELDKL